MRVGGTVQVSPHPAAMKGLQTEPIRVIRARSGAARRENAPFIPETKKKKRERLEVKTRVEVKAHVGVGAGGYLLRRRQKKNTTRLEGKASERRRPASPSTNVSVHPALLPLFSLSLVPHPAARV